MRKPDTTRKTSGPSIAQELHWFKPWDEVLEWNVPFAKWFVGGKLNISYNCLDRHVATWRKNKAAIIWEGEPGDSRTLTYQQLLREVSKCANVLKSLGVKKGDRVAIYMGMVAGTADRDAGLRAHRRAAHGGLRRILFAGADRPHQRLRSIGVITQDGAYRRGAEVKLKDAVDRGAAALPHGQKRAGLQTHRHATSTWMPGRDHWWHELMQIASDECPAEPLDSEHPLYILYTSGTTGKPKGILHTTGGYSVGTYITTKWVFDLRDEDIFWCTADIGWVTGHSYVVYGPLQNGATVVMYEGAPDLSRAGPLLADHREVQGHYLLYGADRHSRVHAAGRAMAGASIR